MDEVIEVMKKLVDYKIDMLSTEALTPVFILNMDTSKLDETQLRFITSLWRDIIMEHLRRFQERNVDFNMVHWELELDQKIIEFCTQ